MPQSTRLLEPISRTIANCSTCGPSARIAPRGHSLTRAELFDIALNVGPIISRPIRAADRDPLTALLTDPDVMCHTLEDRACRGDEAESLLLSALAGANDAFG